MSNAYLPIFNRDRDIPLREEAVGLWAEDYLALADLEDAKADAIEASITAAKMKEKDKW